MALVQDIVQGAHQMMVIDEEELFTPHDDRNPSHPQIVMQHARIILELFSHTSGADLDLGPAYRELRGRQVFYP